MKSSSDLDVDAFLARLETEHPDVAEKNLQAEVDDLLGRPSAPESSANESMVDLDAAVKSKGTWQSKLFRSLPPVLDPVVSIEHARRVEAGVYARHLLDEHSVRRMTPGQRRDFKTIIEEGEISFNILILSNLRLVYYWCRKLSITFDHWWLQDAFQVGCLGLIRGLQGWDYTKGALSTFASWHIRQHIQRWRMNEVDIIRVPVYVWEQLAANPGDLSGEILSAAHSAFGIRFFDEFSVDELESPHDGGIERTLERLAHSQVIRQMLDSIPERECDILFRRHGVYSFSEPATLQDIADEYGLSRERIRQIERDTLRSLRTSRFAEIAPFVY